MKSLPWLMVAAVATALPVSTYAQDDAAAVRAEVERHYAAIRAGDMETTIAQHAPDFTFFAGDGTPLWTFRDAEEQRTEFSASGELSFTTRIRQIAVQVFDNTAIATYYLVGSITVGDNTATGTWRVSEVWRRQNGQWLEVHHHESPLLDSVH